MPSTERLNIAQSAFDFVDTVQGLNSPEEILERFSFEISQFGFESFLITGMPDPKENLQDHVLLSGWPEEWFDLYMERQFYTVDPIAAQGRATVDSFRWSDVPIPTDNDQHPAHEVMSAAEDFGLNEGFLVPIFGATGFQAAVTMAGSKVELEGDINPALQLMSIYAYNRARDLICGSDSISCEPVLTQRQREVLTWTARGKSSWEIGMIVGMSEQAVNSCVRRACRKLDTANRAHAVAVAIQSQEIDP